MGSILKKITGFLIEITIAAVIASLFLVFMPMLSHIERSYREGRYESPILLTTHKPPKPPDIDKKKSREHKLKKVKKTQKHKSRQKSKPKLDIPRFDFAMGGDLAGGIQIAAPVRQGLTSGAFRTAFKLSEVDQPPRLIRKIDPLYPYAAKRKGVEGSVAIQMIVDKSGRVIEATALKAEPEGIFEYSATKAVKRRRFKPATKDGKPVDVIVVVPIVFGLED